MGEVVSMAIVKPRFERGDPVRVRGRNSGPLVMIGVVQHCDPDVTIVRGRFADGRTGSWCGPSSCVDLDKQTLSDTVNAQRRGSGNHPPQEADQAPA